MFEADGGDSTQFNQLQVVLVTNRSQRLSVPYPQSLLDQFQSQGGCAGHLVGVNLSLYNRGPQELFWS